MALTDNLVIHWKLDETTGTREDSVGSNDLTDNNTVGYDTGKLGNAADFELTNNEFLSSADTADLSVGDIDFTWACWVKFESLPSSGTALTNISEILGKVGANVGAAEYEIRFNNYGSPGPNRLEFVTGGASYKIAQANNLGAPSTGTWYFIVAWHDATANTVNIQVNNGTVDSTDTGGVAPSNTNSGFAIGRYIYTGDSRYLDGLVDSVSLWKRTLSIGERTALYNAGNGLEYPFAAPTLSSPSGAATGDTTADLAVTTDRANGTLYCVVTESGTAPSAAKVKAGQDNTGAAAAFDDSQAVSTTGEKTFSATGLTAATTYYAHYMHEDAATNQSTVATSSSFETDAAPTGNRRRRTLIGT